MKIRTQYTTHPTTGAGKIVARGIGGKQKTTNYDHSRSVPANHGIAAANLIAHVNAGLHPLERQNADDLRVAVVRSLKAGYGTHVVHNDGSHSFDV